MKKINLIPICAMGLSLALGSGALLFNQSDNFKSTEAADTVIYIGEHDLLADNTCDEYTGTATLQVTDSEYVLTLDGFNNWVGTDYYTHVAGMVTAPLYISHVNKPFTIVVKGFCNLVNAGTVTGQMFAIYARGTTSNFSFNITGEGDTHRLSCTNPGGSMPDGLASAIRVMSPENVDTNINISNVRLELNNGAAGYTYGLFAENATLNVNEGADVVCTTGSSYGTENVGTLVKNYIQNGGKYSTTAGNAYEASISYGLQILNNLQMKGGELRAVSGTSAGGDTAGIAVAENRSIILEHGSLFAKGDTTSGEGKSYGIYSSSEDEYDYRVYIGLLFEKLEAQGKDRAINMYMSSYWLDGYESDTDDIYSDPNPRFIDHEYLDPYYGKVILYRRILYTYTTCSSESYDGNEHVTLNMNLISPTEDYEILYQLNGQGDWTATPPTVVDAGSYEVEYIITAPLYSKEESYERMVLQKANNQMTTEVRLTDNFTFDGNTHDLCTAGTAQFGTVLYSVNGGEYSTSIPTGLDIGSYEISYKVVGDNNHKDIDPVTLGTVVISEVPGQKGNGNGLPGWAIALIVIGSILLLGILALVLLFFLKPKFIIDYSSKKVIRTVFVREHDDMVLLFSATAKKYRRNKADVYSNKEEAEKALNK